MRVVRPVLLSVPFVVFVMGCASSSANPPAATTPPAEATASGRAGATLPDMAPPTQGPTQAPPAEPPAATAVVPSTSATEPTPAEPTSVGSTSPPPSSPVPVRSGGNTPPSVDTAQAIARGRSVFNRTCATCHEPGEPEDPNPGLNWPEARMRSQIRRGGGRMRAIPVARLSEPDLDALIAHLRSIRAVR